ncbi:MAG: hypothetical protein J2P21_29215, partial [Chloracidobacterium sp.]|nr:hypothetical protein [Chloracidobacterium sp.]
MYYHIINITLAFGGAHQVIDTSATRSRVNYCEDWLQPLLHLLFLLLESSFGSKWKHPMALALRKINNLRPGHRDSP